MTTRWRGRLRLARPDRHRPRHALEPLRGALDGLLRTDAKQAVHDAIQALEAQGGR